MIHEGTAMRSGVVERSRHAVHAQIDAEQGRFRVNKAFGVHNGCRQGFVADVSMDEGAGWAKALPNAKTSTACETLTRDLQDPRQQSLLLPYTTSAPPSVVRRP